jgi:hypothetical protein
VQNADGIKDTADCALIRADLLPTGRENGRHSYQALLLMAFSPKKEETGCSGTKGGYREYGKLILNILNEEVLENALQRFPSMD